MVLTDAVSASGDPLEVTVTTTEGIEPGMQVYGADLPTPSDTGRIIVDQVLTETNQILVKQEASGTGATVTFPENAVLRFVVPGDGSLSNPFLRVDEALEVMSTAGDGIIRIIGNNETGLPTANTVSGRPLLRPGAAREVPNDYHYYIGTDEQGLALADGNEFNVPQGVTVMLDGGAVFRMSKSNVDVGSSSELESRANASIQVLGTPGNPVQFSSTKNRAVQQSFVSLPGNTDILKEQMPDGTYTAEDSSQWGGVVLREDSDAGLPGVFLNTLQYTVLSYGGGQVIVDSRPDFFSPIQLESTRPSLSNNVITVNANAGIAATPNSFEEDHDRIGVALSGNTLIANSINGLLIDIATEFGVPLETLDVAARLNSTEIAYVLQENLVVTGGAGGYFENHLNNDQVEVRPSGRLKVDPGVLFKIQNSRIELGAGPAQLVAEGHENKPIIFTSFNDHRYGAGGTFDTNGNQADLKDAYDFTNLTAEETANTRIEDTHVDNAGEWAGLILNAAAAASIDHSYIAFAGGTSPIEGTFDHFNPIEVHQGSLRLANSRLEFNDSGDALTDRNARGSNLGATVFARNSQPILVRNDFRNNEGSAISLNANALIATEQRDFGRQTKSIERYSEYDGNVGPLIQDNTFSYNFEKVSDAIAGLRVRGQEITVESVWDDTDITHVLDSEVIVDNFHTATGLQLRSRPDESLVVKVLNDQDLQGNPVVGMTATGTPFDIDDRIGGTVQILGQPGFPVIITSILDDEVGAGVDILGQGVVDTNLDSDASSATPGDWRSLEFTPLSNDRNVSVFVEPELLNILGEANSVNSTVDDATNIGILAPNFATSTPTVTNTTESAQEKSGDENRRLGFEVHGSIAFDSPGDVDVYAFDGYAGSEVWIDVDKTSPSLDLMLELLDASGSVVLARSIDSQIDHDFYSGAGTLLEGAQDLEREAFRGGDFYTRNPRDPGFRITLPGTPSDLSTRYFIRLRSQPEAAATLEEQQVSLESLGGGRTSGLYELRVRLRQ